MMKLKYRFGMVCIITLVCLGLSGNVSAQSSEIKIGFVDLQRIIDASAEGQRAREEIQSKADELSQRAEDMKRELQTLKDEYETQSMALTPDSKSEKRDLIAKLERDYSRFVTDSKSELRVIEQRALQELYKDVEKIVVDYAKANNYAAIFERQVLLFASESIDLTDEIIVLYNSR